LIENKWERESKRKKRRKGKKKVIVIERKGKENKRK
jgi:hypothetical protein